MKIYNIVKGKGIFLPLYLFTFLLLFVSCSDDDPFSTITPDDNPMIISPVFPDRNADGSLPTISTFYRDSAFVYNVIVTPKEYTTVTWNIDGEQVAEGDSINISLPAGTYDLKIVATTQAGKSTSREGLVKVLPATGDPYSEASGFERIIAPNAAAKLYGTNLNLVKNVIINGVTIPATYNEEDQSLSYVVPADLQDGTYRVLLADADGNQFGANTVQVTSKPTVTSGADRFGANASVTLTGVNLDKVASLTIGNATVDNFTNKSATELTFTSPDLEVGDYTISGKATDGSDVQFYSANGTAAQQTVTITSETTLWEGHHYVSWALDDGNPNKTFNLLGADVFANIKAGTTLKVYYSLNPADDYHQMQIATGWWTSLPSSAGTYVLTDDPGVIEMTLNKADLDLIQQQAGFLLVGHGYYVDRVTIK